MLSVINANFFELLFSICACFLLRICSFPLILFPFIFQFSHGMLDRNQTQEDLNFHKRLPSLHYDNTFFWERATNNTAVEESHWNRCYKKNLVKLELWWNQFFVDQDEKKHHMAVCIWLSTQLPDLLASNILNSKSFQDLYQQRNEMTFNLCRNSSTTSVGFDLLSKRV